MSITITDTTTGESVTCEPFEIAESIIGWYAEGPIEVQQAVLALETSARRRESTEELAQYLAVRLQWN